MKILLTSIFLGISVQLCVAEPLITNFSISFDWESGSTIDAIPVYSDDAAIRGNPDIFEFAYLYYSSPKIKLQLATTCTNNFILLVYAKNTGGNGFDRWYYNYFYTPGSDIEIEIPITSYISKYRFTWEWTITAIPLCNTGAGFTANTLTRTTEQHLYVILEEPQAPMNPPWAGVLEYVCEWAEGEYDIDVATTKITEHLYYCGFEYNSAPEYSHENYLDEPYKHHFHLSKLIPDLQDPENIEVNCLDMARAVVTFSNALGANLKVTKFVNKVSNIELFRTNFIDPIGDSQLEDSKSQPTNNPFFEPRIYHDCRQGGFKYHAFAETPEDDQSNPLKVWDATLRYDIDDNLDNVEGANENYCGGIDSLSQWQLPCDDSLSNYLHHLVDEWFRSNPNYGSSINCSDPLQCGELDYTYYIFPY
jgi:hypothetical protein